MATGTLVETLEAKKERLAAGYADVCGYLNMFHEQMIALTAELLESSAWEGSDCHSPEHWLTWQTGLSPERARQIVHMARRRDELPVTFAAFAEGLLSVDQVAVVARRAPAHNDREACELALSATVAQLRAGLSKHFVTHPRPTTDPDDDAAARPAGPAGTADSTASSAAGAAGPTAGGMAGHADADAAAGAGGAGAGAAAAQAGPGPEAGSASYRLGCGFDDDGDFFLHALANSVDGAVIHRALTEARDALFRAGNREVPWLDALVEVSKRSLDSVGSVSRRQAYKVVVHLDTDASGSDLEVHHIRHWTRGGRTDTDNLVCLCGRHHGAHHSGQFTISGNADRPNGLTFSNTKGQVIAGSGTPRPPGDRPPPEPPQRYIHPTGERLQLRWLSFLPPPQQHDDHHEHN